MVTRKLLIASGIVGILLAYIFHMELPDMVAIHFGEDGLPDSWVSSSNNFLIWSLFHVVFVTFFLAVPVFLNKLPADLINLPNREYWLAPDKREKTLLEMETRFNVFGAFLNVTFMALGILNFNANKSDPVQMNENSILTIGLFVLIFVILWIRAFYARFKAKDAGQGKEGAE